MSFMGDLRHLLGTPQFRRLFSVRVVSQLSDGFFQVALASYVLFSPEKQPDATSIASAFAVVLLPFSVLGPFVGVFLDRWSRRQVLVAANTVRALPVAGVALIVNQDWPGWSLLGLALVSVGINRFFLAGLSASLPHVVERDELVMANAVTPTSGTIAFITGLGVASSLGGKLPGSHDDTVIVLIAAVGYLTSATLATRIRRDALGPDYDPSQPDVRRALHNVVLGLLAGLRHLSTRPKAAHALGAIAVSRFCYGLATVSTVLLYRNYLNDPNDTAAGLQGLSLAVGVSGVGFFAAALVTPLATARMGPRRWIIALLVFAAAFQVFPGVLFTELSVLVTAFALGLAAQGIKICVDTLVQANVDDAFRGRVFSVYDVIFNVVYVGAAAIAAVLVPDNGKSYAVVALIVGGYAAGGLGYARTSRHAR